MLIGSISFLMPHNSVKTIQCMHFNHVKSRHILTLCCLIDKRHFLLLLTALIIAKHSMLYTHKNRLTSTTSTAAKSAAAKTSATTTVATTTTSPTTTLVSSCLLNINLSTDITLQVNNGHQYSTLDSGSITLQTLWLLISPKVHRARDDPGL